MLVRRIACPVVAKFFVCLACCLVFKFSHGELVHFLFLFALYSSQRSCWVFTIVFVIMYTFVMLAETAILTLAILWTWNGSVAPYCQKYVPDFYKRSLLFLEGLHSCFAGMFAACSLFFSIFCN